MPTERELLALCLKWLRNPRKLGAFDRAMLIEAVQAKLQPRPWVGLTGEEIGLLTTGDGWSHLETPALALFARAIEAKLKEKNQ